MQTPTRTHANTHYKGVSMASRLSSLPADIQLRVLSYFSSREILQQIRTLNKYWRDISNRLESIHYRGVDSIMLVAELYCSDRLWRDLFQYELKQPIPSLEPQYLYLFSIRD